MKLQYPEKTIEYKGVYIYVYSMGNYYRICASDFVPDRIVKLNLIQKVLGKNIMKEVDYAIDAMQIDIDNLIIARNSIS